jgi:hypothetical protein
LKPAFFIAILLCSVALAAAASVAQKPEDAATAFYKFHFAHDMAFTPQTVQQRSQWLTSDLMDLCKKYFAMPEDPDEAPDIEGDVFTGSQEYPDTYKVGTAAVTGSTAQVPMTFIWKDHHTTKGTVVMKKVNNKWLIDDVQFPDQDSMRTLLSGELEKPQTAK